jgi:hypothetical protein
MDFQTIFQKLTPEQRAAFTACTDPFHDTSIPLSGMPSSSSVKQTTMEINLTRTLTASTFGVASGAWDVNIALGPLLTSHAVCAVNDYGRHIEYKTPERALFFGGLMCWGVAEGNTTFLPSSFGSPARLDIDNLLWPQIDTNPNTYISRQQYYVISSAFEVCNVTPNLYIGGSLVRYRVPTQGKLGALYRENPTGVPVQNPTSARTMSTMMPLPPCRVSDALLFPGAHTDNAQAGTYSITTKQGHDAVYRFTDDGQVFFDPIDPPSVAGNTWYSASGFNTSYDYTTPVVTGNNDMVGCYFYGLPFESILQVKLKVYISLIPNPGDGQLLLLAKDSPEYNPKLDQLISHVQHDFPAGVPFNMNPKGEWWKKVMSIGKKVAPSIIPLARDIAEGNVAGALSTGANVVKQLTSKADSAKKTAEDARSRTSQQQQDIDTIFALLKEIDRRVGGSLAQQLSSGKSRRTRSASLLVSPPK